MLVKATTDDFFSASEVATMNMVKNVTARWSHDFFPITARREWKSSVTCGFHHKGSVVLSTNTSYAVGSSKLLQKQQKQSNDSMAVYDNVHLDGLQKSSTLSTQRQVTIFSLLLFIFEFGKDLSQHYPLNLLLKSECEPPIYNCRKTSMIKYPAIIELYFCVFSKLWVECSSHFDERKP